MLKDRIQDDMKTAMKAKEQDRLKTIRLLMAEIKQREIDGQTTLDDDQVIAVISKMLKQRRDSISQYEHAKRDDLAAIEAAEIKVLSTYLPPPLSADELDSLIAQALERTGANSMKDMGKVMAELKPLLQGRVDMGKVSAQIKTKLA